MSAMPKDTAMININAPNTRASFGVGMGGGYQLIKQIPERRDIYHFVFLIVRENHIAVLRDVFEL
jgi:hypothetical protein